MAFGAIAQKPWLYRSLRVFVGSVPGLRPIVRRLLEASQPKPPPVVVEVDGVITLEGLCHLSRQI